MEDERRLNPVSAIVCVAALIAGTVLLALSHPVVEAMIPFALAFGVAALPQPVVGDSE